jgi:hypothetical protein
VDDVVPRVLHEGALVAGRGHRRVLSAQRGEAGQVQLDRRSRCGLLLLVLGSALSAALARSAGVLRPVLPPALRGVSSLGVGSGASCAAIGTFAAALLSARVRRHRLGGLAGTTPVLALCRRRSGGMAVRSRGGAVVHHGLHRRHHRHGHAHIAERAHVHHRQTHCGHQTGEGNHRGDSVLHGEKRAHHGFRFQASFHGRAAESALFQSQVQQCVLRVLLRLHCDEPGVADLAAQGADRLGAGVVEDLLHLLLRRVRGNFAQDDCAAAGRLDIGFNFVVHYGHSGGTLQGLAQDRFIVCQGFELRELLQSSKKKIKNAIIATEAMIASAPSSLLRWERTSVHPFVTTGTGPTVDSPC